MDVICSNIILKSLSKNIKTKKKIDLINDVKLKLKMWLIEIFFFLHLHCVKVKQ